MDTDTLASSYVRIRSPKDVPHAFLRFFGFTLRLNGWGLLLMCLSGVFSNYAQRREYSDAGFPVLWLSILAGCAGWEARASSTIYLLPLSARHLATLRWLWQVPLFPLGIVLAHTLVAFEQSANQRWLFAEHGLWAMGLLALLSMSQVISLEGRRWASWIRSAFPFGLAGLYLAFHWTKGNPLSAVWGRLETPLTFLSALAVPLSFWVVRSHRPQETFAQLFPSALRQKNRDSEWLDPMRSGSLSSPSGAGPIAPWLKQLLARCFLTPSVAIFLGILMFIQCRWGKIFGDLWDYLILLPAFLQMLTPANPRILRRLPLTASSITLVTVVLVVCSGGLACLPSQVFHRVPGSDAIEWQLASLLSLQTLGAAVANSGLLMIGWISLNYYGGGAFVEEQGLRRLGLMTVLVPTLLALGFLALLRALLKSDSDLIGGGLLLGGGAVLYSLLLRRSDRLFRPPPKLEA